MGDQEDIKRLDEALMKCKADPDREINSYEFDDFISYDDTVKSDTEDVDSDIFILPDIREDLADISNLRNDQQQSILLSDEETSVIDSCNDSELKQLMVLNRNKKMQLMHTFKLLRTMLADCQRNMKNKYDYIDTIRNEKIKRPAFWKLGYPYFKEQDLYPSPMNDDTIQKKQNKEVPLYDLAPPIRWSQTELTKLVKGVKVNYQVCKQRSLLKQISNFRDLPSKKDEVVELQKQYDELTEKEFEEVPPLGSNEFLDWDNIAESYFRLRFTGNECRAMWHIYGNPQINSDAWQKEEEKKLEVLVKKYKRQNWEAINLELKTGRTPFIVCLHYLGTIDERFKTRMKFTPQEDETLMEYVNTYKTGNYIPWVKIAHHFENRNRHQLFYRYYYYLSAVRKKRGRFCSAEDVLLMLLVSKFGKNFVKCAEYMQGRTMAQLKSRYSTNLAAPIRKGTFTVEDDEAIMNHVEKYGQSQWATLVKEQRRCRAQLNQRYKVIVEFLRNNPGKGIKDVTRRVHTRIDETKDSYRYLRMLADNYAQADVIPTLYDINKILKDNPNCPTAIFDSDSEDNVSSTDEDDQPGSSYEDNQGSYFDNLITDYFCKRLESDPQQCEADGVRMIDDVNHYMNLLEVNLEIPEDFEEHEQLDSIDIKILKSLCNKSPKQNNHYMLQATPKPTIIPPIYNTLISLRSLLSRYGARTARNILAIQPMNEHRHNHVGFYLQNSYLSLEQSKQIAVKNEQQLFIQRLIKLFRLAAAITLDKPNKSLQSTFRYVNDRPIGTKSSNRTYLAPEQKNTSDNVATNSKSVVLVNVHNNKLTYGSKRVLKETKNQVTTVDSTINPGVKILKKVNLKDIRTFQLTPTGQPKLQKVNVTPVNNHTNITPSSITDNTPVLILTPVKDKSLIDRLKMQIQGDINNMSKGATKLNVFKNLQVKPENPIPPPVYKRSGRPEIESVYLPEPEHCLSEEETEISNPKRRKTKSVTLVPDRVEGIDLPLDLPLANIKQEPCTEFYNSYDMDI